MRRAHLPATLSEPADHRPGDANLSAHQLAVDAQRRKYIFHGLDAGERILDYTLGHLLRADDAVFAGDWRDREPDPGERMASIYAPVVDVPGFDLHHEYQRAAVYPPVFPCLVRLSQQARRLRQLLQQLHHGDASSQAVLLIARRSVF